MAAVAYREPDTAAAARRRLRPARRRVRTYRLVPHESARETVAGLIEAVRAIGDGVLHVTGWEEAFGGDAFSERIYDLNFLRESIVEHPATQVWWMPVAFRDAFMARAPDTWSVVKLKMMLVDPEEYVELSPRISQRVLSYVGGNPGSRISRRMVQGMLDLQINHHRLDDDDLWSLSRLTSLQELEFNGTHLPTLEPLGKLPNLKRLELREVTLYDFETLSRCQTLEVLDMYSTDIEDLSPLTTLRRLKVLNLGYTKVKDLSPLVFLESLVTLDLYGTDVCNISVLKGIKSLAVLNIGNTPARDRPLRDLKSALPNLVILR